MNIQQLIVFHLQRLQLLHPVGGYLPANPGEQLDSQLIQQELYQYDHQHPDNTHQFLLETILVMHLLDFLTDDLDILRRQLLTTGVIPHAVGIVQSQYHQFIAHDVGRIFRLYGVDAVGFQLQAVSQNIDGFHSLLGSHPGGDATSLGIEYEQRVFVDNHRIALGKLA